MHYHANEHLQCKELVDSNTNKLFKLQHIFILTEMLHLQQLDIEIFIPSRQMSTLCL